MIINGVLNGKEIAIMNVTAHLIIVQITKAFSEFAEMSSPLALVGGDVVFLILNLIDTPHEILCQTRLETSCRLVGKSTCLIYGEYYIHLIEISPFTPLLTSVTHGLIIF